MTAYLFLAPLLIGLVVFVAGPLLLSVYYTFTHWDLVSPEPEWVGLNNWQYLLHDARIGNVIWNTVKFILLGTTSFLLLSLLVALLLFRPYKGIGVIRALFFLPYVLSQLAVGVAWRWMFNTQSGPIVLAFNMFGMQSPDWLQDPRYAMSAIAIMTTWQGIGYGMTLYMSALQGIPSQLLEAARVDGASSFRRFFSITLPLISPTVLFLTITSFIGAFQLYDPVVAMTDAGASIGGAGGPNDSTRTIVLYLFNQMFQYSERISGLGYAATIAWMLALIIFIVTAIQWIFAKRWVFYIGEQRERSAA
jgi:multiple sugar transport system permease protein